MSRTVAEKMGVKEGSRAFFVNAPQETLEEISLPPLEISPTLDGEFDHLHLFTKTQTEMDEEFPCLRDRLSERGSLWVSWPKGRKMGTDLSLPEVIRIGYSHGLVESKTISVDETWSAIKFTHPRAGKVYENSFGTLPGR